MWTTTRAVTGHLGRLRVLAAGVAALAGLALLPATSAASERHSAPTPAGRGPAAIRWAECTDPGLRSAGLQCATLRVPLDWARPHGRRITLAMAKRPATDGTRRIGNLLVNNGTGGSAIEQLRLAIGVGLPSFAGALTDRFDLIAVDPRGIGRSTPIRCDSPLKPPAITYFPQTKAEYRELIAHNRALAASCERRTGPLVHHVDLASTARDFEVVRVGLGDAKINWYGIDRTTLLGRTYARLFPGRLRTLTLDTALEDTIPPVERIAGEVRAADTQFTRFAAWCQQDPSCALHGRDVAAAYDALVARADRTPIPAGPGRALTGEDIRLATQEYLNISSIYWPQLGAAIAAAEAGNAADFTRAPDQTLDPAQVLVPACLDTPPAARTFAQIRGLQQLVRSLSPHLGGAVRGWATFAGCLGWPGTPRRVPPATPVRGAPPALITQSTHQALAPYSWAFGLAAQLPGSVVLTREGDDYSNFLLSQCVRDLTNRYLVTGALPPPGTICDAAGRQPATAPATPPS